MRGGGSQRQPRIMLRSPRVTLSVDPLDFFFFFFFFLTTSAVRRQVHVKGREQCCENVALTSAKYICRSVKKKKKKLAINPHRQPF